MAGDWIKMRGNLWDDPRIAKLCDITDHGEASIIGGLYWLWATADQHTENGIMPGLTVRSIDRKTGIQGFAAALIEIGWLADHPEGVMIIKFEEHNGASAKRRSLDAQRKAGIRKMSASDADTLQTNDGQNAGFCGAREREREDISNTDVLDKAPAKKQPRFDFLSGLIENGVPENIATDWIAVRKAKKAANTETALNGLVREAGKAGISAADAVRICIDRNWQGFNAGWDWRPKQQAATSQRRMTAAEMYYQQTYGANNDAINQTAELDITGQCHRVA